MKIERELLVLRLNQINKVIKVPVFICDECHSSLAIIECMECQENLCKTCCIKYHELLEDQNDIHEKNQLLSQ